MKTPHSQVEGPMHIGIGKLKKVYLSAVNGKKLKKGDCIRIEVDIILDIDIDAVGEYQEYKEDVKYIGFSDGVATIKRKFKWWWKKGD